MRLKRLFLASSIALVCCNAMAQYDNTEDNIDDLLFLDDVEEEDTVPPRKEYNNQVYIQYSPTRYNFDGLTPHLHFQEMAIGYARNIRIIEDKPFFAEIGGLIKYSLSKGDNAHQNADYNLWTFRIPIAITYKLYIPGTNLAIAPLAGTYFRCGLSAKESLNGSSYSLFDEDRTNATGTKWDRCQLGWMVGVRFHAGRFYLTATYGRDYPDENKLPQVHECGISFGTCF